MKLAACSVLLVAACFSLPPRRASVALEVTPPSTRISAQLAIAPLIDARPALLRRSHEPALSKYTGVALAYFAFGTGRTDGADHLGDDRIDITLAKVPGSIPAMMDLYVRGVLTRAGATVAQGPAADLTDVTRAAAGRPDGIVVVPILDQLDEFQMESKDTMIGGGGDTRPGSKGTVTAGFTRGTAKTEIYGNVRIRLVLLDVRGGRVARQSVAYVATTGRDYYGLSGALKEAAEPMAAQVAAFTTR